jgi:hypothetical protein
VASASEVARSRERLRIELWVWTSCLVASIVSYPAIVVARTTPSAGLLAIAVASIFLIARATLGYAARRELDRWTAGLLASLLSAAAVAIVAHLADGYPAPAAALSGTLIGSAIMFIWGFVPAIVRDAETTEVAPRTRVASARRRARRASPPRPALGLALLIGFVMLGLAAVWHRGEAWAPDPAGWLVALVLATLGLMFVERMSFSERSAREGNLVLPLGSFMRWVSTGLVLLVLAGLLALAAPWRPARDRQTARWVGGAAGARTSGSFVDRPETGQSPAGAAADMARQVAVAVGATPRGTLALLLLLLLLLAALIVIWGFSRTRAARWLLAAAAAVLSRFVRAWRFWLRLIRRWFTRAREQVAPTEAPEPVVEADPLLDVFDDPDMLSGLSPREVVIRTYHLLLNVAEMLGHGRPLGQTPFEYARALDSALPAARDPLRVLTWGYAGAMYADETASVLPPTAVRQAWLQVAAALKGDMTPEDLELRRLAYLAARRLERGR